MLKIGSSSFPQSFTIVLEKPGRKPLDGNEGSLEIMGDNADKVLKLFVLSAECFLGSLLPGDIHGIAQYGRLALVFYIGISPSYPDGFSLFGEPPGFVFGRHPFSPEPLCPPLVRQSPILRMDQLSTLNADQLLSGVTVNLRKPVIGEYDAPVLVDIDAGQGVFNELGIVLFALLELLSKAPQL